MDAAEFSEELSGWAVGAALGLGGADGSDEVLTGMLSLEF